MPNRRDVTALPPLVGTTLPQPLPLRFVFRPVRSFTGVRGHGLQVSAVVEVAMPWSVSSVMSERLEFVSQVVEGAVSFRELCRRFGISAPTGYKWLRRFEAKGAEGLEDQSRRPLRSPTQTPSKVQKVVCELRRRHPAWGGRKIRTVLLRRGWSEVPAASTITGILRRHGLVDEPGPTEAATTRFERPVPNELWQMDFKGHFPTSRGRCHPLTVLDDHSRFSLCLAACRDEQRTTVTALLESTFGRYGMPQAMLMDNGSPWGGGPHRPHTRLSLWLMRLGIGVIHSRPYHPQTLGKDERFHATLNLEVIKTRPHWRNHTQVQADFDDWRDVYNFERPHEALDMATPADRYQPSRRSFPDQLPPIHYPDHYQVRKVQQNGILHFQGHELRIRKVFIGQPVALRPTTTDGTWTVLFIHQPIATIDLTTTPPGVNHVPARV